MSIDANIRNETVAYVRLSQRGEKAISIERQNALGKEFSGITKTKLVKFEEPKGHRSGRDEKRRPAWKECKAYIGVNHPRIKYFWSQDSDRVSRDAITRLTFFKWLESLGIQFVSHLEPHLSNGDMPKAERNLMNTMSAGISQHYADWISEKMLNHIAYVKAGGGVWGHAPRGLRPEGKGIERRYVRGNEEDLAVLAQLSVLYLDNADAGIERVVKIARDKGLKLTDRKKNVRLVLPIDFRQFLDGLKHYDGILDPVLLARLREHKTERSNRAQNGRRMHQTPPILHRLVFCVHCGGRYWIHRNATAETLTALGKPYAKTGRMFRHPIETCKYSGQTFAMSGIEDQVWNDLSEYFVLSEDVKREIAQQAAMPRVDPNVAHAKELQTKLERLEVMYLDCDNVDGVLLTKERYVALRAGILAELDALPKEPAQNASTLTVEDAISRLGSIVDLIRNHADVNTQEVNMILRAIIEKIMVDGGEVVCYVSRKWCAALFPKGNVR